VTKTTDLQDESLFPFQLLHDLQCMEEWRTVQYR